MFAVVAARPPLRAAVGKAQVVVEATPTLLRCAAGVDVRVTSTWQERDVITSVDARRRRPLAAAHRTDYRYIKARDRPRQGRGRPYRRSEDRQ